MGKSNKKSGGETKTNYKEEWLPFVIAAVFLFMAYMNENDRILFAVIGLASFVIGCLIIRKKNKKDDD